jgi:hypothetical protein
LARAQWRTVVLRVDVRSLGLAAGGHSRLSVPIECPLTLPLTLLGRIEFARFETTYFLTELPLMLVAVALFRRHDTISGAPAS